MEYLPILSDSRSKMLHALATFPDVKVHLRLIHELSQSGMRSTQLVLKELKRKKVVSGKRSGNRSLYSLNPRHHSYRFILDALTLRAAQLIALRAATYSLEVRKVFEFIDSAERLFTQVRR